MIRFTFLFVRNSAKILTEEDKRNMHQDLNVIHKWAEDNMKEFNDKKFEQIHPYNTIWGSAFLEEI